MATLIMATGMNHDDLKDDYSNNDDNNNNDNNSYDNDDNDDINNKDNDSNDTDDEALTDLFLNFFIQKSTFQKNGIEKARLNPSPRFSSQKNVKQPENVKKRRRRETNKCTKKLRRHQTPKTRFELVS